ncbi:MAG: hypothetical protein ACKVK6_16050, partial [bacterium]
MRKVAVVGYAQTPNVRSQLHQNEVEMLLSIIFAPCLWCDLSRDWADIIGATDASEEGFGGVHASVPPSV